MNSKTAVKICGITRPEDGLAAAQAGAHAIGLVFYARSPRFVDAERARAIARALPPFVTVVGLFVDAPGEEVAAIARSVPLQLLQFHGEETPGVCAAHGLPYLKALRVKAGVDLLQCARAYSGASGLLLDAHVEGVPGGTGARFDWSLIPKGLSLPVVLAGGLNPHNAAQAVRAVRPWALDVSSGVESAPGIKDPERVRDFIQGVRDADV